MCKHLFTYRLISVAMLLCVVSLNLWGYSFMERGIAYNASGTRAVVTNTSDITNNYNGLRSARIPATVVHEGVTYTVTTINDRAFLNCPTLSSMTILPGVTRIGSQAFQGCLKLSSISIPQGIVDINDATFAGCVSLETVVMASSVTSIGSDAFAGCSSLKSLTLPLGTTLLAERAFKSCASLHNVDLSSRITTIKSETFADCIALDAIVIPDHVTTIEDGAFDGCTSLTSVSLGRNLSWMSPVAFAGCSSLSTIEVNEPNRYFSTQDGALTDVNRYKLIFFPPALLLDEGHFTMSDRYFTIGEYAFVDNVNLKTIKISNSLAEVEQYAFSGCTSLDTISFPYSTRYYGDRVFDGCSKLRMARFSNGVLSMGSDLFHGCDNLTSLHLRERNPHDIDIAEDAFDYIKPRCTLYVPVGQKERYESMDVFKGFKAIVEEAVEIPGDINGDDISNGADLTYLYNYLLDGESHGIEERYFDVNGDGIVNGTDITELYNILLEN